jgi:hypothetical protein
MPSATTSDDAASDRACHALAMSIADLTRSAARSMYRNKASFEASTTSATISAVEWTGGIS